jgi:PilZ domain-containing protein
MSSGGAMVVSEHEMPAGARVEVSIAWPSLLEGKIPLQLVTLGRVMRCAGVRFAVSFDRYQFRILRSEVQSIRASDADAMEWSIKKAAGT